MEIEFHEVRFVLEGNFLSNNHTRTKAWAEQYLALADENRTHWNYGNAIHHANIFLGRIALKNGDIEAAKAYLINAGNTPGSPQLNSFGPNMSLAKELLEIGEISVVLMYFDLREKFWQLQFQEMFGFHAWRSQIKNGQIPDFKANMAY